MVIFSSISVGLLVSIPCYAQEQQTYHGDDEGVPSSLPDDAIDDVGHNRYGNGDAEHDDHVAGDNVQLRDDEGYDDS
jgi:hypothetical protein